MKASSYEIDEAVCDESLDSTDVLDEAVADEQSRDDWQDAGTRVEIELDSAIGPLPDRNGESGQNVQSGLALSGQPEAVDHYGLSPGDRLELDRAAERILSRTRDMTKAYVLIGEDLTFARSKLAKARDGAWSEWIDNEVGLGYKHVMRIVNAYRQTKPVLDEYYDGEVGDAWERITPTAFYRFAKLDPEQIRQLIELARNGHRVWPRTIDDHFGLPDAFTKDETRRTRSEAGHREGNEEAATFDEGIDPIVGLVQYFRDRDFDCLVRSAEDPLEGPFAVLFYRGEEASVSDWGDIGKARPAEDIKPLSLGDGS